MLSLRGMGWLKKVEKPWNGDLGAIGLILWLINLAGDTLGHDASWRCPHDTWFLHMPDRVAEPNFKI